MSVRMIVGMLVIALSLLMVKATALDLGDPAPPLNVQEWLKGGPVDELNSDTIYVIEFWATWCPPCRTSIPHLSELQRLYRDKGVVVIGLSDEDTDTIREFVTEAGDAMDYRVGRDADNQMWDTYAAPFGADSIPYAVVVDTEGRLVWQGHPMDGLDEVLAHLVEGTFDADAAREISAQRQLDAEYAELLDVWAQQYYILATYGRDTAGADAVGAEILAHGDASPRILSMLAWDILTDEDLEYRNTAFALELAERARELTDDEDPDVIDTYARALYETGRVEEAIRQQNRAIALSDDEDFTQMLQEHLEEYTQGTVHADMELSHDSALHELATQYAVLAATGTDYDDAQALGEQILADESGDHGVLNKLAWFILTEDDLEIRDLQLALALAHKAAELTNQSDADVLDTYALALFLTGDVRQAIVQQDKALEICNDDDLREGIESRGALYRAVRDQNRAQQPEILNV